ncbi:GNAT family N-acetyltransferase [Micromonospora sp. ATA32]|nr:GNAT family N-acetyltransferase [Micromonospora sp. ATA32]
MFVREATLADVDRIVDIHTRARSAYYTLGGLAHDIIVTPTAERERRTGWTESIRSSEKKVLCAVTDGQVVGIAAMGPPLSPEEDARSVGQLYQIHVGPGVWGNGIGSVLHAAFVQYLADVSLSTGLLEVWERNTRAQAFYARHGWRPTGSAGGPDQSNYVFLRLRPSPAVRPR